MTFFFLSLVFTMPAMAQVDLKKTINLAGKQRMLTQKMAKESLEVALNIDAEKNLANLSQTQTLFSQTLHGLRKGDDALGLTPVKKPKIQNQLNKVKGLWADYDAAINNIVTSQKADSEQIKVVSEKNLPVLKEMNRAVKFYQSESLSGDLNPSLAAAINIAGRQRMLTQKMSKEFFLIAYGVDPAANRANLQASVDLFQNSLNSLTNGNASEGLTPAPTPEIKAQLEHVAQMWTPFKAAVLEGPTDATKVFVTQHNMPLLVEMNKAVMMYEAYAV